LTTAQREALTLAIREDYYSIPRETSSQNLADQLDISDQALTERLRRAIVALTTSTLHVDDE
jgi:predicted DNA binding protein